MARENEMEREWQSANAGLAARLLKTQAHGTIRHVIGEHEVAFTVLSREKGLLYAKAATPIKPDEKFDDTREVFFVMPAQAEAANALINGAKRPLAGASTREIPVPFALEGIAVHKRKNSKELRLITRGIGALALDTSPQHENWRQTLLSNANVFPLSAGFKGGTTRLVVGNFSAGHFGSPNSFAKGRRETRMEKALADLAASHGIAVKELGRTPEIHKAISNAHKMGRRLTEVLSERHGEIGERIVLIR